MTNFNNYNEDTLNGYAAEACLNKAAAESSKIHSVKLQQVIEKCKHSKIGRKHLEAAYPFLTADYGDISFDGNRRISILDEDAVPEEIATDIILGLDLVVSSFGYNIGIDITVNQDSCGKKLHKKQSLAKVYKEDFDIDFTIILIAEKRFDSCDLEVLLRRAIKDGGNCQIVSV